MKTSRYYSAALTAFAIWGFFSFALKPIAAFRSADILFYRVFFCAILMVLINLLFRFRVLRENLQRLRSMPAQQRKRALRLSLGGGALLTANWFFFIYVMNHISIKAASFAYLVCPILTTVLAYFILKEQLSRVQWIAVGLSLLSCLLLSFDRLQDIAFSMIVAISYALYLITQRRNEGLDKFLVLSLQLVFSALLLLPFFPAYGTLIPYQPLFYSHILLIAIMFTIVPLYLNLYALQGIRSSVAGILLYINPLLNFIIAILCFHETVNAWQAASYALILFSILLFNSQRLFKRG